MGRDGAAVAVVSVQIAEIWAWCRLDAQNGVLLCRQSIPAQLIDAILVYPHVSRNVRMMPTPGIVYLADTGGRRSLRST